MLAPRSLVGVAIAAALALATAASALAADESPAPIPTDGLEGLTWQLGEQVVDGSLMAIPDGVVVTLLLQDGHAGGNGGCNQYSGAYMLDGANLTFGPLVSTMMACEGPAGDTEAAYYANLATTATWFSDGGSLTLQDAAGSAILVFIPAPEPLPADGIEGVTWQLSGYLVGGDAVASVPQGVVAWMELAAGTVTGNGGCNSFSGAYALDGATITFEPVTSTLMLCEGPGGEVETVFFEALPRVATWASDGSQLTLSDADGTPLLMFVPAPEQGLAGSWVASGINDGQGGVVSSPISGDVTAIFGDDGELSGSDGCNTYRTTYTIDGEAIAVAPEVVSTRMACPSDEHAAQAAQYVASLTAATRWAVTPEGRLELRDDTGALQVSFVPAAG
jgi:heat shock protein HslJ